MERFHLVEELILWQLQPNKFISMRYSASNKNYLFLGRFYVSFDLSLEYYVNVV